MSRRPIRVARKAINVALEAVPGAVVEAVTARTAPLSRYSGRTQAGAAALSSALAALAQPPRPRARRQERYNLAEIATLVDQPADVVQRWADRGMLGAPEPDAQWSRDSVDRAMLIAHAARHGASDDELQHAAENDRLPLVMLEHVIAGEATLSAREVSRRAGVPLETAMALWRALGLPVDDPDELAFSRNEVAALRTLNAMRPVFTDGDLLEASSVVGRAMADVAAAAVELFRRRLTARLVDSGADELDVVMRLSAIADLLVPPLGPLLEVVLRHHLSASVRGEAALRIEQSDGASASQRELCVAFADLVGFTTLSDRLSVLEVSEIAARLLRCAEAVLPRHDARIVKSIGDAVMFTARDPVSCCRAALDLMQAAGGDAELPPVRCGAAHGPVLRAYADYFGQTVNIASRLCDVADPGAVYLHVSDELEVDAQAWSAAGLTAQPATMRVKGIQGRLAVLRVSARG